MKKLPENVRVSGTSPVLIVTFKLLQLYWIVSLGKFRPNQAQAKGKAIQLQNYKGYIVNTARIKETAFKKL